MSRSGELMQRVTGRALVALLVAVMGGSCRSPAPAPSPLETEIVQLAASGRGAFARGAYAQAARFYEQALQRARAADDGPEIARNGYNLAACLLQLGRATEARVVLRESLTEFGRYRMDAHPALLLDARAARAAGQPDEARAVLDAAFAASKSDAQRVRVWLDRGDLALDAGDQAAAMAALEAVNTLSGAAGEGTEAARLDLAGRVALASSDGAGARAAFEVAASLWQRAGQMRNMAVSLGRAGEACSLLGDRRDAMDRHYRAARSLAAQGDALGALRQIERGLAAGGDTPDPDLESLLRALFESLSRASAPVETAPPAP